MMPAPDRITIELERVAGGVWIGVAKCGAYQVPGARRLEPELAAMEAVIELRAVIRREDDTAEIEVGS